MTKIVTKLFAYISVDKLKVAGLWVQGETKQTCQVVESYATEQGEEQRA